MDGSRIDLEQLAKLGRLSQSDAQGLHTIFCTMEGITDPDEVIARWNKVSPRARWNCPPEKCRGKYVRHLTDLVLKFMKDKIAESRAKKKKKS